MDLVLRGGRVLGAAGPAGPARDVAADVRIRDGRIVEIAAGLRGGREVAIADLWVLPGLVDLHCHLREPGAEHKEDLASGARAVVFAPTWVIMGVGATAVWLIALGALGDRRIRLTDDRVELGGWAPGLRPTIRGTITAVRVRTTFMRRKGDDVARPTRHDVAVQTTRGERTIASFEHPADAHALAAVIDEHFALVPPAEPLGAPDLDDPPAR